MSEIGECSICYENKRLIKFQCGHSLDYLCYLKLLKKTCPMCRAELNTPFSVMVNNYRTVSEIIKKIFYTDVYYTHVYIDKKHIYKLDEPESLKNIEHEQVINKKIISLQNWRKHSKTELIKYSTSTSDVKKEIITSLIRRYKSID